MRVNKIHLKIDWNIFLSKVKKFSHLVAIGVPQVSRPILGQVVNTPLPLDQVQQQRPCQVGLQRIITKIYTFEATKARKCSVDAAKAL